MKDKREQEYTTAQRRRQVAERYAEELRKAEEIKKAEEAQVEQTIIPEGNMGDTIVRKKPETEDEKKKRHPMSKKKKKAIIISVISVALVLLIVAGIFISAFIKREMFGGYDENAYGEVILDEEMTGIYTCLLVATDKSKSNTDTIMLAVMRYDDVKRIDLISIPRDTRVMNPSGKGGHVKINSIMARNGGKINALVTEVRNITGIPINDFMLVDIEAVKKSVDMFGGVMFDVPMDMHYKDELQDLYINLDEGMQLIDGKKAEQLLRFRAGYSDADLGRTRVQREFMVEAFKQHAKASNLGKIGKWYAEMGGYVQTQITYEKAYKYALVATSGDFEIEQRILPGTVITGSPDYFYNAEKINEMAKELGFKDSRIVSTPRPNINQNSGVAFGKEEGPASTILEEIPLETVVPTVPSTSSADKDDEPDNTDEPDDEGVSSSDKPGKADKPNKIPSGTGGSKPSSSPSSKPGATHNGSSGNRDESGNSSEREDLGNPSGNATERPSAAPSTDNNRKPEPDDSGYPDGI